LNPMVSVVVTTYNQAAYIEQTLKSVFAQTYYPYEVIVVDDGSTDDTPARISAFGNNVIYIRQKNQGVASSRNTGIRQARGDYIAFLDGDDLWEPEKISDQIEAALRNPNSGLIVVDGSEFDDAGIISSSLFFVPWCRELPEESVTTGRFHLELLQCNFISTTSQVMVPAKVFQNVGISDRSFMRASDYDLYIRIAAEYDITIVKKRLTRWRCLPTSVSGPRRLRGYRYLPEEIAITQKHFRQSSGEERSLLRHIVRSKLAVGAEKLYYYGLESDRAFATRMLWQLLAENNLSPRVAAFLIGLWCPLKITRIFGQMVRRMLFKNCTETQNTMQDTVSPM
jgi:glycosyltransferase involved in cell wall biosynthesis